MVFDKSKGSFRAGIDANGKWDDSEVGVNSTAFGIDNVASSFQSFAAGVNNEVSGSESAAFGWNNNVAGRSAFAAGEFLTTESRGQISLGSYNTTTTGNAGLPIATDRLFVIGNGTNANRSDALTILKNGNTTLNGSLTIDGDNAGAGTSYTLPAQDGASNQIMSTDGSGNVSWVTPTGAFNTTVNVTSNGSGDIATDNFVFGSTQLDNIPNDRTDNARFFFNKNKAAFRLGFLDDVSEGGPDAGTEWDDENLGFASIAMGIGSIAKGNNSISFGQANTIETTGNNSITIGQSNTVNNISSSYAFGETNTITSSGGDVFGFAFGANNTLSTGLSFGLGYGLIANSRGQMVLGLFNEATTPSGGGLTATDPYFVIGNGTDFGVRSNALVMQRNGNTTLNGQLTIDGDNQGAGQAFTLPAQDGSANQVMSTDGAGNVSWVNAASGSTFSTSANVTSNANGTIATDDFVFGSTQLDDIENNATDDVKMYFDKSKGSFRAGTSLDSGGDAFVWNPANAGDFSVAMGRYSLAQGTAATAFGTGNNAGGENAFAAGFQNLASRPSTVALGARNSVSGYYAIGIGRGTQATSYGQHTVGVFSEGISSNDAAYIATDPLFVVGNGVDDANRSNALVMTKNGNTQLNGSLTIDGDNVGSGASYTFPAQDGAANQVMTTDGSGNVSWSAVSGNDADADPTNEIELPAGGTNGQILNTNGSGVYSWVNDAVNDADADPTNEIELPAGGTNGQVLITNGSGGYSWSNDAVNDADNDPTNEIELPTGGTSGQVLQSDGSGGSQWTSNVSAATVETPALTITGLPTFCADLSGTLALSGAGSFLKVPSWRTSDAAVTNLHDNGNHFDEATGAFTAPVNGFYFFSAQVRFDGINSGFFRLLLGVEGALSLENGLHAISEGDTSTDFHTLSCSSHYLI